MLLEKAVLLMTNSSFYSITQTKSLWNESIHAVEMLYVHKKMFALCVCFCVDVQEANARSQQTNF